MEEKITAEKEKKFREYFSEMSVRKSDTKSLFSGLNLPSYVRDWFVRKYSDENGQLDTDAMLDKIHRVFPEYGEWNAVLDRMMNGEEVKILARVAIRMSIRSGEVAFALPDYAVTQDDTYIDRAVWDSIRDSFLSENECWGVLRLAYRKIQVGRNTVGKICLIGYADFKPYNIDLAYFKAARRAFTLEEWMDILLGAIDYNADGFADEKEKTAIIKRLLPFVENRLNLIELAPKGTGKSYLFSQISKYGWLVSGGTVTRAKMFYDMQQKQEGLVCHYDFVALDEISTICFPNPDEMRGALKGYLESGTFTVGAKTGKGVSGVILLGNIRKENMTTDKDMFCELPEIFHESALLDRFHGFIEGWEIPRMNESRKKIGWAINSEYMADVMHALRADISYGKLVDELISVPVSADVRDTNAIKKIAAAHIKLLFPHWQKAEDVDKEQFLHYCLEPAVRMRGTIRKQLSIMDSEYPAAMAEYGTTLA